MNEQYKHKYFQESHFSVVFVWLWNFMDESSSSGQYAMIVKDLKKLKHKLLI